MLLKVILLVSMLILCMFNYFEETGFDNTNNDTDDNYDSEDDYIDN